MKTKNKSSVKTSPTIFVIDDDQEIRDSLCWLLQSVHLNVESYDNANTFLKTYDPNRNGCIVVDVRMPGMSGLELLEILARQKNIIPVIIITGHGDIAMAVRAMKAGAYDFILKPFNDQQLLEKIQNALVLNVTQETTQPMDDFIERMALLTSREREVLEFVINGSLNKQIAHELNIALSTVELHRSNAMHKLKTKTLADLIRFYVQAKQMKKDL